MAGWLLVRNTKQRTLTTHCLDPISQTEVLCECIYMLVWRESCWRPNLISEATHIHELCPALWLWNCDHTSSSCTALDQSNKAFPLLFCVLERVSPMLQEVRKSGFKEENSSCSHRAASQLSLLFSEGEGKTRRCAQWCCWDYRTPARWAAWQWGRNGGRWKRGVHNI